MKKKAKKTARKPPVRRLNVYNAMEIALRKENFLRPGALGAFLVDKFLSKDHYLTAQETLENGFHLDKKNAFANWRQNLVDGEWIVYDHEKAVASNTIGKCSPGKRLNGYLNKEKILNKTLVTTDMLDSKVNVLQGLLRNLIELVDPPYTDEKAEEYEGNTKLLVDAIETKILENGERPKPKHPDYDTVLKN